MSTVINRGHAALDRLSRAFGASRGAQQELFAEALEELAERAATFIATPPDGAAANPPEQTSPSPSQDDDGDPDGAPAFRPPEPAPVKSIKEEQGSAADVIAAARARISVAGRRTS